VRYCKGEKYNYHYDYFVEPNPPYQRLHTFLIYLNDLSMDDGGATSFKNIGVRIYPKAGRAIWFRDAEDDGTVLPETLHSGEEILTDKIKYAINVWIRNKKFA
jgi:prolyl 4-hydroxylase